MKKSIVVLLAALLLFMGVGCTKGYGDFEEGYQAQELYATNVFEVVNAFDEVSPQGFEVAEIAPEEESVQISVQECEVSELNKYVEMPLIPQEPEVESEPEIEVPLEPRKLIAFTFDDGPSRFTEGLLDALQERNAKATFFILGSRVAGYKSLVLRMFEEGHEIGNHSFNHPSFHSIDRNEMNLQIRTTNIQIEGVTGVKPKLFRPPYGRYNTTLMEEAKNLGVSLMFWSLDTRDWQHRNTEIILDNILSEAVHGSIILLHDIYETSVLAVIEAVDILIEQGYEMVTVSELFEYLEKELEPGVVYWGW